MRRYLVVANVTLTEPHLLEKVKACIDEGECAFHLVVPASPPQEGATWTESQAKSRAQTRLDEGLTAFKELGVTNVTGEVGDASPVAATADALMNADYDEIILSTLPPGPSRWLKQDVVSRMQRRFDVPVTHVAATA